MRIRARGAADILALAGLLSFCSLVYEMAIAASFVSLTGDGVFWQSATIAVYLAALGAGTYAASRWKSADPWAALLRVEVLLAAAGAVAVPGIFSLEAAYRLWLRLWGADVSSSLPYAAVILGAHGWTVLVGFLSGFELPLLMRLLGTEEDGVEDRFHWVLGANYLGAPLGALAFSFVLFPRLEAHGSALAAAVLNLLACLYVFLRGRAALSPRRSAAFIFAAFVTAGAAVLSGPARRFFTLNFYAGTMGLSAEIRDAAVREGRRPSLAAVLKATRSMAGGVESLRSRWQAIDFVSCPREPGPLAAHYNRRMKAPGDWPAALTLYLDRRFQLHGATESLYHEFLAHVPVQVFGRVPRDVLILGGGDGLLARELLKYREVRSVVNVELDARMVELARTHPGLRRLNEGAYEDPRVRLVVDDAFFFVRRSSETFDAVYIDLPTPDNYDLTRLYSAEFYAGLSRLLREGGFAAADYPMLGFEAGRPREDYGRNSVLFSTLKAAGFRTVVPYSTECAELMPWSEAEALGYTPSDYEPEVAKALRRVEARRFLRDRPGAKPPRGDDFIVVDNRAAKEEMVAFAKGGRRLDYVFKDHGIPLNSLTPERLDLLRFQRFPYEEGPSHVNSILRPRLFRPVHLSEFAFF